jgi:hypothetical protein
MAGSSLVKPGHDGVILLDELVERPAMGDEKVVDCNFPRDRKRLIVMGLTDARCGGHVLELSS